MTGIVVRPATDAELDAAGQVAYKAYDAMVPEGRRGYLETVSNARKRALDSEVLVAFDGDDMVGTVTWCPVGSSFREVSRDDEGEFRTLAVTPEAQGRGIAQALVQAIFERARAAGYTGVVLCSDPWMTRAHSLYLRMGFTRATDRDWTPRPGIELWTFHYDLHG